MFERIDRILPVFWFVAVAIVLSACGEPAMDPNSTVGAQAIIDQTNIYLTNGDCSDAISTILPLYNSSNTSNEVRMIAASAYACDAKVNFFGTITNIGNAGGVLSAGNFFGFFADLFQSTSEDKVVESSGYAMNILMTAIPSGTVILPSDETNSTSDNPGSLNVADRTVDSDIYLLLVSMAAIGGNESRYGNPNASFLPQNSPPLPFDDNVTKMTDQGCIYAAGLLNFFDSISYAASSLTSSAQSVINQITSYQVGGHTIDWTTVLNLACNYGCLGTTPAGADALILNPSGTWNATGCSIAGGCTTCPTDLRDYTTCHPNVANDPGGCAAAGLANLVNVSIAAW
jgi:hypothetical protein